MKFVKKLLVLLMVVSLLFVSCDDAFKQKPENGQNPGTDVPVTPNPDKPNPDNPDPENPNPGNPDPENPNPENPDPENPDPGVKPDTGKGIVYYKISPVENAVSYKFYIDGKLAFSVDTAEQVINVEKALGTYSIYMQALDAEGNLIAEWFDDVENDGAGKYVTINPSKTSGTRIYVRNAVGDPHKAGKGKIFGVSDETLYITGNKFSAQTMLLDFELAPKKEGESGGGLPIAASMPPTFSFVADGSVTYENGKIVLLGKDQDGKEFKRSFVSNGGKLYGEDNAVYSPVIGTPGQKIIDSKWQIAPVAVSKTKLNDLITYLYSLEDRNGDTLAMALPSVSELASLPEDLVIFFTVEFNSDCVKYLVEVTPKVSLINGSISLNDPVTVSAYVKMSDKITEEPNGDIKVDLHFGPTPITCTYSLVDGSDGGVVTLSMPITDAGYNGPVFKVPFRRVEVNYPEFTDNHFTSSKTFYLNKNVENAMNLLNKAGLTEDITNLSNNEMLSAIENVDETTSKEVRIKKIGKWSVVAPSDSTVESRLNFTLLPFGLASNGSETVIIEKLASVTITDHHSSMTTKMMRIKFNEYSLWFYNSSPVIDGKNTKFKIAITEGDIAPTSETQFSEYIMERKDIPEISLCDSLTKYTSLADIKLVFNTENMIEIHLGDKLVENGPKFYYSVFNGRFTFAVDPSALLPHPEMAVAPADPAIPEIKICLSMMYNESKNMIVPFKAANGEKFGFAFSE